MNNKFITYLYLLVLISTSNFVFAKDKYVGEGQLQLDDIDVKIFAENYLNFPAGKSPSSFWIAQENGKSIWSFYWYCPNSGCMNMRISKSEDKEICEQEGRKYYKNQMKIKKDIECFIFAKRYKIVWDNGNQPDNWKQSMTKAGWSKSQLSTKLKDLGFYDNDLALIAPKDNKKKTPQKIDKIEKTNNSLKNTDIISQIKDLKNLLDSGVITQEEFTKAKKKLLK